MNEKMLQTLAQELDAQVSHERRAHKDIANHHIPTVPIPPLPTVDRMLDKFYEINTQTAKDCILRAEELEAAAHDLRERAAIINHQCTQIPDDYRRAVAFEIESRNRAASLSLVNPRKDAE